MPLDPEAQAILKQMSAVGAIDSFDPFELSPAQFREAFSNTLASASGPEIDRVEMLEASGPAGPIPVRVYTPAGKEKKPGLVFFHGGGFVICDLDSHDSTCRELAAGADCVVVSVDYRLAPEAKFPAAPEDCFAATQWTAREADRIGIDVDRIAVAGDSAGGNLAAVVALMCRDQGGPDLVHQLLIYPVTDHGFETESYQQNGEDYFLTRDMMRWFWHHYLESDA
ncbi:MAG: alpha/beta hydrolase, partial [Myxococcota bacterium]